MNPINDINEKERLEKIYREQHYGFSRSELIWSWVSLLAVTYLAIYSIATFPYYSIMNY